MYPYPAACLRRGGHTQQPTAFYPLRYVRVFGIANPSVVCLSVTFVRPTQGVETFGNISSPLCTLVII